MDKADVVIIGAGVVGLAVAAELAARFRSRSVVVLERNPRFGQETSSRNSEVIHAGIYYPRESLKALLCVEGNRLMVDFCRRFSVPHAMTGKLIVAATLEEAGTLEDLLTRGRENGVEGLEFLDAGQVKCLEPDITAAAAVFSPSTGVVDSHRLMTRLEALAGDAGAVFAYGHEAASIDPNGLGYEIRYRGPGGRQDSVLGRWLVNCAGLCADGVAAAAGVDIDRAGYRLFLCKGEYFSIPAAKARRLSHLIYPPPYRDLRGLGIHVTKWLDGMAKLGPNAFYVDRLDYAVDPGHAREFFDGIKAYLPFIEPGDLQPDMAGIRPKVQRPGEPIRDFIIRHESDRGLSGLINLVGIESPGLTSCLSIAKRVAGMVAEGC